MSENKDTMVDDAIEWLNEIRCWINRCKDTEWGDDDQSIVDFIATTLQSPRVAVLPNLQKVDLDDIAYSNPPGLFEIGFNTALNEVKSKYGELYAAIEK